MIIEAIVTAYVLHGTMANGKPVHLGAIACPRKYELGTRVKIQGVIYTCEDRTSRRYDGRWDIWMEDYRDAINFGKRKLKITICK